MITYCFYLEDEGLQTVVKGVSPSKCPPLGRAFFFLEFRTHEHAKRFLCTLAFPVTKYQIQENKIMFYRSLDMTEHLNFVFFHERVPAPFMFDMSLVGKSQLERQLYENFKSIFAVLHDKMLLFGARMSLRWSASAVPCTPGSFLSIS